eukprot:TRINITY_DN6630_c0_g1_i1.p1 TRINITY_DN6630_c0_g1~~TRINITY_DN6630_c0_g1_i1.p1  ORF type:complete len:163 (+),score=40.54 TRINITY_DN6630_c0_g1_i1:123-611(+)
MSNLQAATARMGTGKSNPADRLAERSQRLLKMSESQERRYVQQWKDRIDGEARAQSELATHCVRRDNRLAGTTDFFRSRNMSWADKAHQARLWRDHLAHQKLERCSSMVSKQLKQNDDFGHWYERVLVQTPRELLSKRNKSLSATLLSSNLEVERYHRATLG